MNTKPTTSGDRIVRIADIKSVTGVSRSASYAKLDKKSSHYDPAWPVPVRLSARSVGYKESELLAWLESRPRVNADPMALKNQERT